MNATTTIQDETTNELPGVTAEDAALESGDVPRREGSLQGATATYDVSDNKCRLRVPYRLDRPLYERVRAAGFLWARYQESFVAPMWTPEREDLLLELAGEIGEEDTTLLDRAEQRAERFEWYQENRARDKDAAHARVSAIADGIPMGQPILVGHHSERRARRDAEKIRSGMARAVMMWEREKYWSRRIPAVLANVKYKEQSDVRHRRIKGLEADARRQDRTIDEAEARIRAWDKIRDLENPAQRKLYAIRFADCMRLPATPEKPHGDYVSSALEEDRMTVDEVADMAETNQIGIIARATRWRNHVQHRLTFERAMLGEAGGVVSDHHDVAVGGKVLAQSWRVGRAAVWLVVTRVNRTGGAVQSVSTPAGVIPIEEVKGYEAPTDELVAKVKAASKLPPLVNYPGEGFVELTRAQWDRRASDEKKAHRADATATHGAYRYRRGWVPGGSWKTAQVYLTDAPRVERPILAAVEMAAALPAPEVDEAAALARLERREAAVDERAAREAEEAASPFAKMKESLKAGVTVVVADQLFPTPPALAARVVEAAEIETWHRVLEPSSGTGNLVAAVVSAAKTDAIEVVQVERNGELARRTGARCADFLAMTKADLGIFDRVVMNPPFADGQDVAHVRHALSFLRPGGKLVAIMSAGLTFRNDRGTSEVRHLVAAHRGTIEPLPDDSFASSGTNVRTVLVTVTKGET